MLLTRLDPSIPIYLKRQSLNLPARSFWKNEQHIVNCARPLDIESRGGLWRKGGEDRKSLNSYAHKTLINCSPCFSWVESTVHIRTPTSTTLNIPSCCIQKTVHTFLAAVRSVQVPEYSSKHVMAIQFASFVGRMAQRKVIFNS